MACTYPATYTTADISSPSSFGVGRSASGGRRSSRSSSTSSSSRRSSSSSSSSSRVRSRDSSPNPLDAQIRKSRAATCTLSLTHVYVPGTSSALSGATTTATAMMSAGAALLDTRLPRVDDGGGDMHVDVMIERIRGGVRMESGVGVGVGVEEMTTEEQEQVVPEFTAALKSSSRPVPSPSPSRATGLSSVNQIPFPTSSSSTLTSTSIVNATTTATATRATTPSTASTNAAAAGGSSPAAHILLRTTTLPPSSAMNMQRPSMSIRVAPLAARTGSTPATSKPADTAPPARRSRKSSVSLHGVPIASKARVSSSRTGKSIPIPIPMPRRKIATALGDHILDEDSPKVKEREAERLAVSSVTTTNVNARGESSSPPPYSPEPPPYEAAAVAAAAAAAAQSQALEGDGLKPTLHQPQPIRPKSYVDLSLLKPSLVAQLSKSQSKSKSPSSSPSTTPKSSTSTSPPPRRRVSSSDVRILLHLYRTLTVGLEKRHRAYEAAKAAERLEEAARIARKKLEGQWRFPIVEEDVDGEEECERSIAKVGCESVLDEDEEERILVPATPPPTRNSSRSSTPTLVACSPSPYHKDEEGKPRHTAKFKPELEVQDAILSIRLRNFLKAQGVSESDLEVRFSDEGDVVGVPEVVQEEEEEDGGSVTYDLLQEDDEDEEGDSVPAETAAVPAAAASAPLPTTPPPPSPPPKPSAAAPFVMPQTNMIALLTMRHRYTAQRGRRSSKDNEERDAQGKKKRKMSTLKGVVATSAGVDGRGFEGVVVECVDEDAEERGRVRQGKEREEEEDEEEIIVARG